jgi:hypothetical protein
LAEQQPGQQQEARGVGGQHGDGLAAADERPGERAGAVVGQRRGGDAEGATSEEALARRKYSTSPSNQLTWLASELSSPSITSAYRIPMPMASAVPREATASSKPNAAQAARMTQLAASPRTSSQADGQATASPSARAMA